MVPGDIKSEIFRLSGPNGTGNTVTQSGVSGKGIPGQLSDLAYRLSGSSDLYGDDGRKPCASINFVTCHDGFTLNDLVSYNQKHNEANFEENRDGADDNISWNCGVEGPSDDQQIKTTQGASDEKLPGNSSSFPGSAHDSRW